MKLAEELQKFYVTITVTVSKGPLREKLRKKYVE